MTAQEKASRRRIRHELQRDVKSALQRARMMGSYARTQQIHAAAKVVTDRYFSKLRHVPATVQPIEEPNGDSH